MLRLALTADCVALVELTAVEQRSVEHFFQYLRGALSSHVIDLPVTDVYATM